MTSSEAQPKQRRYAWYRELNRYQWFVLIVASLGWAFDTMAQQLFNIARVPAIRDLLGARPGDAAMARAVSEQAGYATMIFTAGWAVGGVFFDILGDRLGRAKTMIMTILMYSIFTGLSVFAVAAGQDAFRCQVRKVRVCHQSAVRFVDSEASSTLAVHAKTLATVHGS